MTEIRFSYNPFTKHYIESDTSHSIAILNAGKQKQFDEYIRGIILDETLYLRLYYPYKDLGDLTLTQLKQNSRRLLEYYRKEIEILIDDKLDLGIKEIKYNVENDLLKGIGLANI